MQPDANGEIVALAEGDHEDVARHTAVLGGSSRPHAGTVGCLLMQALPVRGAVDTFAGVVLRSPAAQPVTLESVRLKKTGAAAADATSSDRPAAPPADRQPALGRLYRPPARRASR